MQVFKTNFFLKTFFKVFFCVLSINSLAFVNLEEMAQDFVVHTQQIIMPEYPHAFNPSIIRWSNSLLMSFRVIPDPARSFNSWIGLVWLDENFQPRSKPQELRMRSEQSNVPPRLEDGRLITVGERLYLVYSDNEDERITRDGFRMYIAELHCDGEKFIVKQKERLSSFEYNSANRREKNWVPFEYQDKLLLAYSLMPHRILCPLFGDTEHCDTLVSSESLIDWDWGELRGGTPGLLDGEHYLAFFHSSKPMVTVHSHGQEILHYVMGAYTFSREYPFAITSISNQPIIGKQFYNGFDYKPYWAPVRVVFPCGFIVEKEYIWVAYGRQDHEIWIAQIDKSKLYESLIPVSPKPEMNNKCTGTL